MPRPSSATANPSGSDTVRGAPGNSSITGPVRSAEYELEKAKADLAFHQSVKNHYIQSLSSVVGVEGDATAYNDYDPRASVYLGQDTTLDPDFGDKYESDDTDSYQDAELTAESDVNSETIEAYAWDNAGYGTFFAWAYVGREFVVEDDSGSQTATITFQPDVTADMGFGGECGNGALLEFLDRRPHR
jgi:hypothetical protein